MVDQVKGSQHLHFKQACHMSSQTFHSLFSFNAACVIQTDRLFTRGPIQKFISTVLPIKTKSSNTQSSFDNNGHFERHRMINKALIFLFFPFISGKIKLTLLPPTTSNYQVGADTEPCLSKRGHSLDCSSQYGDGQHYNLSETEQTSPGNVQPLLAGGHLILVFRGL